MKLKWIKVENFGPFYGGQLLNVDSEVTVVTGKNDVGKTLLLKATQIALTGVSANADQINQERVDDSKKKPGDDDAVCCEFEFEVTERTVQSKMMPSVQAGDKVVFRRAINRNVSAANAQIERKGQSIGVGTRLDKPPLVFMLPGEEPVRSILPLKSLTETELRFLRIGFGTGFNPQHHIESPRSMRSSRVARAQQVLNDRLKEIFPTNFGHQFYLNEINATGDELNLGLRDVFESHLPLENRGQGLRKVVALMGVLLAKWDAQQSFLILIDEPENSLHADAQHSLRRLLEKLAKQSNVQVIYATHSPSMINNMRPGSIRLLERRVENGKPFSVILNEAFQKNFVRVRSNLGLTPADSLLFAPVTIIVEGATEVRCLPILLEKLRVAGVSGCQDVIELLGQIHFLDGEGDNYSHMIRLSKSQNAKPILFLDGDKSVEQVRKDHPDVPIVVLPPDKEFENLIPEDDYLDAVPKVYPDASNTNKESFHSYVGKCGFGAKLLLSKRVERWLEDICGIRSPKKHLIMERAIEGVAVEKIQTEKLVELITNIRASLK